MRTRRAARVVFSIARAIFAVAIAGGSAESWAQDAPDRVRETQPIPEDLRDSVARSAAIGELLFLYDRVAAIGTDALLAKVRNVRKTGVAGFLAAQEVGDDGAPKSSYLVYFYTSDVRIAHAVRVAPKLQPTVESFSPPADPPPSFATLVRARKLAIDSAPLSGQPLNPVIVDGEVIGEEGLAVYLLAGTTEHGVAVLGRHTRVLVSDDGSRVLAVTPLTQSVIEQPVSNVGALFITQPTAAYPLESFVFTSLLSEVPIYVSTERGLWVINGKSIEFLGDDR